MLKTLFKTRMMIFVMMTLLLVGLPTVKASAEEEIAINEANFPDLEFRNYIAKFDRDYNKALSQEERDAVLEIEFKNDKYIQSVQGIHYFTNLRKLTLYSLRQLESLDISALTNLNYLQCSECPIKTLDISKNTNLQEIHCSGNELTELDLSHCPQLEKIYCNRNSFTTLDFSHCPVMKYISCGEATLESLIIGEQATLTELYCERNKISSIDVSRSPSLKVFQCDRNTLTELDIHKNTKLEKLICERNRLKALDITQNTMLKHLEANDNQIAILDTSSNPDLEYLEISSNQIKDLDLTENTNLKNLRVFRNQLQTLDISHNQKLEKLHCAFNQLERLDIDKNKALKELYCTYNHLTGLDLSGFNGMQIDIKYQSYTINVDRKTRTYDLKNLPNVFDQRNASNWQRGHVEGSILTVNPGEKHVGYKYDAHPSYVQQYYGDMEILLYINYIDTVTVTYDANGGSGTMEEKTLDKGGTYKLLDNAFTAPNENQEFKTWEIDGEEAAPGAEITVDKDTVVKALWKDKEPETATVTFHANGHGTAPKAVTVKKGATIQEPTAPSADGYLFGGWYTEPACEHPYAFTTPVTEDITLYAKWTQKNTTPPAETYTITVDPSGGNWNGETGIRRYPVEIGSIFVLDEAPAREGYTFLYWRGSKYDPGDRYRVTGNHTFTAVWEPNDDKEQDKPEPTEPRKTQTIEIFKRLQRSNDKVPTIPRAGVGA